MPTWGALLGELGRLQEAARKAAQPGGAKRPTDESPFDLLRRKYLKRLYDHTGRNVVVYASNFTTAKPGATSGGPASSINLEDIQGLMEVFHGLAPGKLDLILHSPGGVAPATDAIVKYTRTKFDDVRIIVPHAAMSAACMLACSANRVVMGKHSFLGPIDPQLVIPVEGVMRPAPAHAIVSQFRMAQKECLADPRAVASWLPMLKLYGPALIEECRLQMELSKLLVGQWLERFMFAGDTDAKTKSATIANYLADHEHFKTHSRMISREDVRAVGMIVDDLETDQTLQDLVLSVYHANAHTFAATPAVKIIENHLGKAFIKMDALVMAAPAGLKVVP